MVPLIHGKPSSGPEHEVFRPDNLDRAARLARRSQLRRVASGLYTTNLNEDLAQVVRRNWLDVVGLKFPGCVLVGRSATLAAPAQDGSVFVDVGPAGSEHPVRMHGLTIKPRRGPGRLPGDMPMGAVFISSRPRAALENCAPSRARGGVSWTLSRPEFEAWLEARLSQWGAHEVNELRDAARQLAQQVGGAWLDWFAQFDSIVGALQGTRDSKLAAPAAMARAAGRPFDAHRVELFDLLRSELLRHDPPMTSEIDDPNNVFAFFEAYFSNFVEGTEFEVEEAAEIVFEGVVPTTRPEDAHDVLGTYRAVVDPATRGVVPTTADEFIELARKLNHRVLERRPSIAPGEFKQRLNRAGATVFVAPELVEGTLRQAWRFYETLPVSYARAVFAMFALAEVHPFNDGNGRCARLLMNAELTAGGLPRFVVPLSYRTDYLDALRALSRRSDPTLLPRMTDRILRWVSLVDWGNMATATEQMRKTNALISHDDYETDAAVLLDP
jgi:hypothetical protein